MAVVETSPSTVAEKCQKVAGLIFTSRQDVVVAVVVVVVVVFVVVIVFASTVAEKC